MSCFFCMLIWHVGALKKESFFVYNYMHCIKPIQCYFGLLNLFFYFIVIFYCYSIDYLPKASSLIWKKESIAMQNSSWCINSWVWFQWANFICPDMYANAGHKFFSNCFAKISLPRSCIYLFVPNAPFLYPLKASENHTVFWCFQGIEKGGIGNEWVNCQNSPKAFPLKSSREDKLHIEPRTVQIDVMMKYSINPKVSTS